MSPHSREWRNWQTRWIQVPVFERTWGFKSPLAHSGHGRRAAPRSELGVVPGSFGAAPLSFATRLERETPWSQSTATDTEIHDG